MNGVSDAIAHDMDLMNVVRVFLPHHSNSFIFTAHAANYSHLLSQMNIKAMVKDQLNRSTHIHTIANQLVCLVREKKNKLHPT